MRLVVNPDLCHDNLAKNAKRLYEFNENLSVEEQGKKARERLIEITGIKEIEKNACPLSLNIIKDEMKDGYRQIQFTFESEKGCDVPCYILIPDTGKDKYPVAITMQGHSSGFHNSVGIIKPGDEDYHPRGAFGVQAVRNGFISLCIENRGMGCRSPKLERRRRYTKGCEYPAKTALLLGRSLIGERMWDISKAIDLISTFEIFNKCDTDKILITGNSGGGTISYYTAVYDNRIKLSAPSCAFCTYDMSILKCGHCSCNYFPEMRISFEMQDLATAIAPRNLIVIAGVDDNIFLIDGVKEGFETVKKIYEKVGALDKCRFIQTPKGHWWCDDLVWPAIKEETAKLGWWN